LASFARNSRSFLAAVSRRLCSASLSRLSSSFFLISSRAFSHVPFGVSGFFASDGVGDFGSGSGAGVGFDFVSLDAGGSVFVGERCSGRESALGMNGGIGAKSGIRGSLDVGLNAGIDILSKSGSVFRS
jgi:hypothetical protein